jgi:hypothetical protein
MTIQILLNCNGTLPSGMSCRGALSTRTQIYSTAFMLARRQGWTLSLANNRGDLCPSCTRRGELDEPAEHPAR